MRRDVSRNVYKLFTHEKSSLHAQRCFQDLHEVVGCELVFSACAEMFPGKRCILCPDNCLLCMRRDVSISCQDRLLPHWSSLHAQRCFCWQMGFVKLDEVFSACAEMFPVDRRRCEAEDRLLCMRRDVSELLERFPAYSESSLHAQRCFPCHLQQKKEDHVFSACAEMFPYIHNLPRGRYCLLCMRRDVSLWCYGATSWVKSSLHAQRCFSHLQTDHKYQSGLLCMRRDVSLHICKSKISLLSSLHAQRCF